MQYSLLWIWQSRMYWKLHGIAVGYFSNLCVSNKYVTYYITIRSPPSLSSLSLSLSLSFSFYCALSAICCTLCYYLWIRTPLYTSFAYKWATNERLWFSNPSIFFFFISVFSVARAFCMFDIPWEIKKSKGNLKMIGRTWCNIARSQWLTGNLNIHRQRNPLNLFQ